ncbi:MAG TPA: hypothetical protein VGP68_16020 [Gemmataceae bacterium]|jgi:hypothetical protein|nr:hypothetical protein [Gemmataceae bacterium]
MARLPLMIGWVAAGRSGRIGPAGSWLKLAAPAPGKGKKRVASDSAHYLGERVAAVEGQMTFSELANPGVFGWPANHRPRRRLEIVGQAMATAVQYIANTTKKVKELVPA